MAIRFRSRHLHATLAHLLRTELAALGWMNTPAVFGAAPVTVVDYQPDERGEPIARNTVAVTIGDVGQDEDEELGGGLRSAWYPMFVDIYMQESALSIAMADDLRDILDDRVLPVVNQITGEPFEGVTVRVEEVIGPERPQANIGAEAFKKNWRIIRAGLRLYYNP